MERNRERSLDLYLEHEGGYVNNKNDRGGPTNKGVTLANFRRWVKPGGTIEDLKKLTVAQAKLVFEQKYWNAVNANHLPDGLDYSVGDFAINSGPRRAGEYLQRLLREFGYDGKIDGVIGPKSLAAVGRIKDVHAAIEDYNDMRLTYLKGLKGPKGWQTFGDGWEKRVKRVKAGALQMANRKQTHFPEPEPKPIAVVEVVAPTGPVLIERPKTLPERKPTIWERWFGGGKTTTQRILQDKGTLMSWWNGLVASTAFNYTLAIFATMVAAWLGLDPVEGKATIEAIVVQIVGVVPMIWGVLEAHRSKIVMNGERVSMSQLPAEHREAVKTIVADAQKA